ncbi:hypothetical protein OSB04_030862 [Centaurea solstitialis]|uniref:CCHC-type domain-containing protein n=1 Tax=Centaurea solstitialis TaxID=347529 RepID=A0AA38W5F1_9ASTR|nr:hypothetical protein OSB04_030862 [Centaurea solstitialis]
MANTVTNTNNLSLRSILEKDKLTGANFLDWERNLMIVLRHERKWYVLEEPLGEAPPANATANVRNAYRKHSDDLLDVGCLMLATMSPDLQTGLINTNAYDIIRQLRDMFQTQARTERYDATRAFNACKMAKGTSVSDHVMKMKKHIDHLERLGHPVPLQLATDTILNSLSEDYKQFVINYNMNNMEKTIAELHSMLKTAELSMGIGTKTKDVLMVGDGGAKRKRRHGNTSKGKSQSQASQSVTKVENNDERKGKGKKVKSNKARTENRCFICHELGHWRQNCPKRHKAGNNASARAFQITAEEARDEVPKARARAFQITAEEARDEPDVVTGIFLVNSQPARILFDFRATNSFVSHDFVRYMKSVPFMLPIPFTVDNGVTLVADRVFRDCSLVLDNHDFFERMVGYVNSLSEDGCGLKVFKARIWVPRLGVKAEHQKPYGSLQPLEVPMWKWEELTMDLVTKLPKTQRQHDSIWVIVDRLTKSALFLPVRESYSMDRWAQLYIDEVVSRHGVPVGFLCVPRIKLTRRKLWISILTG